MSISPLSHSISPSILQSVEARPAPEGASSPADLKKAAGQFEAILLRQFLKPTMDSLLSGAAGGGGGPGSDIYGYFLTDVISGALSEGGGMGLSNILQHQLGAEAPAETPNLS